jgi:hypothetical protein
MQQLAPVGIRNGRRALNPDSARGVHSQTGIGRGLGIAGDRNPQDSVARLSAHSLSPQPNRYQDDHKPDRNIPEHADDVVPVRVRVQAAALAKPVHEQTVSRWYPVVEK